ncbi:MAG TPA: histidinol-phosphate transaminase, partial [Acidobacteriota bacterium]|nr:histidinol-phosphate transaminase [Acidobacteriota bacterium]
PQKTGKSETEMARELGLQRIIRMASNENAWGPSPLAVKAIQNAAAETHLYPAGNGAKLRKSLATRFNVSPDEIILGNGSTELIDLIARTYLSPEQNAITADQTFPLYWLAVTSVNANCIQVPTRNHAFDLPRMRDSIDSNTRLLYIANPNNPTGSMVSRPDLEAFLTNVPGNVVVVLDEAYMDFADPNEFPNGLNYLKRYPNIIVLRTFSKVYGLAGMRLGYAIACPEIITNLNRVRMPYNTSLMAEAGALAALEDQAHVQKCIEFNRQEREFLTRELESRGIRVLPSAGNFLLMLLSNVDELHKRILTTGVFLRPTAWFGVPNGLRITVGKHDENMAFLDAVDRP